MMKFFPAALICAVLLPIAAFAQDPRRDALLSRYQTLIPGFAGFSAQRGEALFRTNHGGGDQRTPACTSCHTDDPRNAGRNAKTGRTIDPVAVSANAGRFVDLDQVEKQFTRDCKSVLGRECSAQEKGDYITFMAGR